MAVREGHVEVVPAIVAGRGRSRPVRAIPIIRGDKLLAIAGGARLRGGAGAAGGGDARALWLRSWLLSALAEAIKGRDRARVEAVLAEHPEFIRAADALGNGPLHWAALTRQKRLGGFSLSHREPILKPAVPMARRRYWSRSTATTGFRTRDLPAESAARPMDRHPSLARFAVRNTLSALHVLLAMKTALMRYWRPIRAQARTLDAGWRSPLSYAARNGHTRIVEKTAGLGCRFPISPKKNAPRGGALFGACAGKPLADGENCCSNAVPIPTPRWTLRARA